MSDNSDIPVPGERLVIYYASYGLRLESLTDVTVERTTPGGQVVLTNGQRWSRWAPGGTRCRVGDRGRDAILRREIPGERERIAAIHRHASLVPKVVGLGWNEVNALPTAALEQIVRILTTKAPLP